MNFIILTIILFFSYPVFSQVVDPRFMTFAPANSDPSATDEVTESYYVKKPGYRKVAHEEDLVDADTEALLLPKMNKRKSAQKNVEAPTHAPDIENSNPESEQGFSDKMKDILLGGDLEKIDRLRVNLEKNDTRKNIFDLSIGTFYLYNTSQSNYYFRNYNGATPGAFVSLNLWVTPFLGFSTDYKFTILNSIKDGPTGDTFISANQDWLSFGLKFRRFFGAATDSSSFIFSLSYFDHKIDVPANSAYRARLRTRGPEVGLELSTPSSKRFFWNFGFNIRPYVNHEELVNNVDIRTGAGNQTVGLGTYIGGEYKMNRKLRTFFRFSADLNRSQFSGNALSTDPVSNTVPSNVVVNDAYYFLKIGLIFGY